MKSQKWKWVKIKWYKNTHVIYVSVDSQKVGACLCVKIDKPRFLNLDLDSLYRPKNCKFSLHYIILKADISVSNLSFSTFLSSCEAALSTALVLHLTPDLIQHLFLSLSHSFFFSHGFITHITCSFMLHSHWKGNRKMPAEHMRWKILLKGAILLLNTDHKQRMWYGAATVHHSGWLDL